MIMPKRKLSSSSSSSSEDDVAPIRAVTTKHKNDYLHKKCPQQCEFCNEICYNRYDMMIHNSFHIIIPLLKLDLHTCNVCSCYFTSRELLDLHFNNKHSAPLIKNEEIDIKEEYCDDISSFDYKSDVTVEPYKVSTLRPEFESAMRFQSFDNEESILGLLPKIESALRSPSVDRTTSTPEFQNLEGSKSFVHVSSVHNSGSIMTYPNIQKPESSLMYPSPLKLESTIRSPSLDISESNSIYPSVDNSESTLRLLPAKKSTLRSRRRKKLQSTIKPPSRDRTTSTSKFQNLEGSKSFVHVSSVHNSGSTMIYSNMQKPESSSMYPSPHELESTIKSLCSDISESKYIHPHVDESESTVTVLPETKATFRSPSLHKLESTIKSLCSDISESKYIYPHVDNSESTLGLLTETKSTSRSPSLPKVESTESFQSLPEFQSTVKYPCLDSLGSTMIASVEPKLESTLRPSPCRIQNRILFEEDVEQDLISFHLFKESAYPELRIKVKDSYPGFRIENDGNATPIDIEHMVERLFANDYSNKQDLEGDEVYESVHYLDLINSGVVKCNRCPLLFPNRFQLVQHEATHLKPNCRARRLPHLCYVCDFYVAGNYFTMKTHFKRYHPKKVLKKVLNLKVCRDCNLRYMSKPLHEIRYHIHTCPNCTTRFVTERQLTEHEKLQLCDRVCQKCHYIAESNSDLNCHTMTKHPPLPRQCTKKICKLCWEFYQNRNILTYNVIGEHSEIGKRQHCSKCSRKCFELLVVETSRKCPQLNGVKKQVRSMTGKLKLVKSMTNEQRLVKIQQRLKQLSLLNKR